MLVEQLKGKTKAGVSGQDTRAHLPHSVHVPQWWSLLARRCRPTCGEPQPRGRKRMKKNSRIRCATVPLPAHGLDVGNALIAHQLLGAAGQMHEGWHVKVHFKVLHRGWIRRRFVEAASHIALVSLAVRACQRCCCMQDLRAGKAAKAVEAIKALKAKLAGDARAEDAQSLAASKALQAARLEAARLASAQRLRDRSAVLQSLGVTEGAAGNLSGAELRCVGSGLAQLQVSVLEQIPARVLASMTLDQVRLNAYRACTITVIPSARQFIW